MAPHSNTRMIGLGTPSALSFKVPSSVQSTIFKEKGLLVIVFDEACNEDESDGSGHQGGGRVPMVLVSSRVKPGYRSVALYHHENTLRLMLEALGLASTNWPGAAKEASSMAEFFTSSR